MAFRITESSDASQKISAIPLAAATGTRATARYDGAATSGTHTTFVAAVFCEEDTTNGNQLTIWELYNGATCTMAVRIQYSAGNWILSSHLAGSSSTINWTLPIDPRNKWLMISMCHINRTSGVSDRLCMAVYDFSTGLTHTTAAGVFTGASSTAPTHAAIGNNTMFGSGNRNMRGIVIPAIRTDAIWDGTSPIDSIPTVAISALAAGGITGHISYNAFSGVLWATNFVAGSRTGADSRDGKTLTTGNMYGLDANHGTFPGYAQIVLGCAVTGTISAVDPYDYGSISYPPLTDTTVGSDSLPATALTMAASGKRRRNTTRLGTWINTGSGSGQVRVGFFGNSRAVYPYTHPLRLTDATYPGRNLPINFTDMGLMGQAGLWNNGRIIGITTPPATCNWTGTNQLEGAYGVDCSGGLLRCKDSGGTVVNPSAVLSAMTSTTLGTRMTMTARAANTPPANGASADNAYGAGNAVKIAAGCTARWMVRPESGFPVTDSLTITLRFLNHPKSSSMTSARKVVAAGQNDAEDSSSAVTVPGLGPDSASTPPTAKSITAVSAASLTNQVTHSAYGYVVVDDSDLGFSSGLAPLAAGDLMQLQNSGGVSATYSEAWVVRSVTGQGTDTCQIAYEWLPRQAPIVGDQVTYVKGGEILIPLTVTFSAAEVAAGKWRGVEVVAGTDGDGLVLYEIEVRNPDRDGVHPVAIGRTGCGAWIQAARWPRINDENGLSLSERHFANWDLDVIVLTTADQGTASGNYVASYDTLIDYVQADSPTTEIVVYSTGPEWTGESTFDKSDAGNKYDWSAVMQYSAAAASVPHAAFLFGRNISAFGRITTGDDTTEGPVHPGTVLDVSFLGAQIAALNAAATSLSHGFGGRTRSGLRWRADGGGR